MTLYKCSVCHHLNGVFRLRCQVCSAVPAMYSIKDSNGRELMAAFAAAPVAK